MRQVIKKLLILILLLNIFTAAQEKTCVDNIKLSVAPSMNTCTAIATAEEIPAEADTEVMLMPISRIIIMQ